MPRAACATCRRQMCIAQRAPACNVHAREEGRACSGFDRPSFGHTMPGESQKQTASVRKCVWKCFVCPVRPVGCCCSRSYDPTPVRSIDRPARRTPYRNVCLEALPPLPHDDDRIQGIRIIIGIIRYRNLHDRPPYFRTAYLGWRTTTQLSSRRPNLSPKTFPCSDRPARSMRAAFSVARCPLHAANP